MNAAPIVRDILLVGGGHSHALVIRRIGMRPMPGVRVTLVSDGVLTPYSGMLPGLVAGHYSQDDVHVDLFRLCLWAGVRFIDARMTALDPQACTITLADRPAIGFDLLSLDTGSTPDLSIEGAARYATPVKPVHDFRTRWDALRERLAAAAHAGDGARAHADVAVVGSGAGGFEIAMAVRHALPRKSATVHWMMRDALPLGGRHDSARRAAARAARDAGLQVHTGFDVTRIGEGPVLHAADGRSLPLDELLWCTGATGPGWPAAAGLDTDTRGFVATDDYLRSRSHPHVFATGDIGTQIDTPAPKAGVHAVRQAPVLYRNLCASVLGEPLERYRPQRDFLSLMATGPRHAIASRGPLTVSGDWVWRWKDWIDRRFMHRFEELPVMAQRTVPPVLPNVLAPLLDGDAAVPFRRDGAERSSAARRTTALRCTGCGAKVTNDLLSAALDRLGEVSADAPDASIVLGVDGARDVAIIDPGGQRLVQSVDQLSALIDDPWRFARIATLHALADVLTVDAIPHSVLLSMTLPSAGPRVQRRELDAVLDGVMSVLQEHKVRLIGGHTAEGPQLQIGLTVNALQSSTNVKDPVAVQPGDVLLLSRPIGSGVLFAGAMRTLAHGADLQLALLSMSRSQQHEAIVLREHGACLMTDVTGFGLAGHLERLLDGSGFGAVLDADCVPFFDGAVSLARRGVRSSAWAGNVRALDRMQNGSRLPEWLRSLLADPQTAGGLLAVVPADRATACIAALSAGEVARVGTVRHVAGHIVTFADEPGSPA